MLKPLHSNELLHHIDESKVSGVAQKSQKTNRLKIILAVFIQCNRKKHAELYHILKEKSTLYMYHKHRCFQTQHSITNTIKRKQYNLNRKPFKESCKINLLNRYHEGRILLKNR